MLRAIRPGLAFAKCYMNMRPPYQLQVVQSKPSPDQMCERLWTLPVRTALRC